MGKVRGKGLRKPSECSMLYKNNTKKTWVVIYDTLEHKSRSKSQSKFVFGNLIISDTDENG